VLDLKFIRENPEAVRRGLAAKNSRVSLDSLLELDQERRACVHEVEQLKAKRNQVNDEITRLKKAGESAQAVIDSMKAVSQKIKELDSKVGDIDLKMVDLNLLIPNMPHETVPVSSGPEGNRVIRTWGEPRKLNFKPKNHLELSGPQDKWFSMAWGSKLTGSGFPVFKGAGARLERGLISFMLDMHTGKHGFTEIWPPSLVNRASMTGTGQLPKMEEDMYRLKEEDYFLIPTAEVPVTNLLRDETLVEKDLPVYYTAYTPCFRREAGSYGKDTQGLMRVHQFDKVEMVKFVKPEDSLEELESLVGCAEAVLQALELPYRVVLLSSGDMSFAAAKCYDLEVWAPGAEKWCEVSSCSTFWDFQARRANIRFRRESTNKLEYVHTLNGSGLALPRIVLCLLENFQNEDGSVSFPAALEPYLK